MENINTHWIEFIDSADLDPTLDYKTLSAIMYRTDLGWTLDQVVFYWLLQLPKQYSYTECPRKNSALPILHFHFNSTNKPISLIVVSTDAVFLADITQSMKFVSLNVIFLSFPIGCQFQFQILADRWLNSSMLRSTARCRQEFLIDTLLGNEYFLTVLPV